MSHDVFDRGYAESSGAELTPGLYNLTIGAVLLWGFSLNWLMVASIPASSLAAINPFIFYGAYFVLAIGGVFLFRKSDNPTLSFLGYNMVAVPFGAIVNLVVANYEPDIVLEAVQITTVVTFGMMVLGSIFPAFFQKIIGAISAALVIVIIVQLLNTFFLKRDLGWMDWVIVLIFCGYIGYDWGRANRIPKTLDNAIDSAASLYIDIINLFLTILRILGRRK
jgi:FtsH-binding integral membrane protein